MPELVKFDWPSSFELRSELRMPLRCRDRDTAAADQRHVLANPEAGVGTSEQWVLEHRVEAVLGIVVWIVVA